MGTKHIAEAYSKWGNDMKRLLMLFLLISLCFAICSSTTFAHSGRTDSAGGHKDNKNVSGLGSYHYHHGYGPHLHPNGICPYSPKDTIKVDNMPSFMSVGDSINLSWTVTYYSGSSAVSWSSSEESIISVSSMGELNALSAGSVKITAELHNGSKSFNITSKPVLAESIIINGATDLLEVDDTIVRLLL